MLYAINGNEKIEASPHAHGICPNCEKEVMAKCGEINIWHWGHYKNQACDGWYEPETEWHKNWKYVFGIDNSEISIRKDGVRHIADVLTRNEVVIELQNSPIQKHVVRQRENFYGERMLWLINGIHFISNFTTKRERFPVHWMRTSDGWINTKSGELRSTLNEVQSNEYSFIWSYARKTWKDVQRPVFIDFGGSSLFWVSEGMGTSKGYGLKVKKSMFLEKYNGNLSLLEHIIIKHQDHTKQFQGF